MLPEEIKQKIEQGLKRLMERSAPTYKGDEPPVRLSLSRLTNCPRQLIFFFLTRGVFSEDDDEPDRGWGVLVAGIWWEEFLAKFVFPSPEFKRQCRINLMGIEGHCDFLRHETDGKVTILEIKTKYEVPNTPLPSHYVQINAYMLGVKDNGYWLNDGAHVTEPITNIEGYLIYLNRDNPADFAIFHFPEPDEKVRQIVNEMRAYLDDFVQNGVIPPVPKHYHPFKFPCFVETRYDIKICPFHENCWGKMQGTETEISPLLSEGFRRWLEYKESEENYRRFVDTLIRPMFSQIEKSLSYTVTYLNDIGMFKVTPRRGARRLNIDLLRRQVENLLGRKLTDEEWETAQSEATVEGEPTIAIEFRRIKP